MTRSAIIASLMFHGGLLFLVGWQFTNATRISSARAGAEAWFLADGPLFTVPSFPPEPATEPQLAAPVFIQPPPVTVLASSKTAAFDSLPAAARERPVAKRGVSGSKGGRSAQRGAQGAGAAGREGGLHVEGYVAPRFLLRYKPRYPAEARARRLEGTVLLLVSIDVAGQVTGIGLLQSCGHQVLDRAALAAVRAWRFNPARQDGVAVAARVEVPVRFRFEEHAADRS